MARLRRLYAPGVPQYVAQRAAAGRTLFADDDDFRAFVALLGDALRATGTALHAYVLLPDEIRLVATPRDETALPRLMQALGRRYVPLVNRKSGRQGPLWSGRYRSTLVDPDAFLVASMVHVEQRPRARRITDAPGGWRWSSERHHTGFEQQPVVVDHAAYWALSNTPFERQAVYGATLETLQDVLLATRIERAVDHGWALGGAAFLDTISAVATRRTSPRPAGRPRLTRP